MSQSDKDQKDIEEMHKLIQEDGELERRKQELAKTKLLVDEKRYQNLLERDRRNEKELEDAKTINFVQMSPEQIAKLQNETDAYLIAARHNMKFMYYRNDQGEIVDLFDGIIPLFRRNLILIAGKTGKGKSTAVTNIIYSVINQKNPITGERCKVLHITNEENAGDAYNKLTCLSKGWNYTNHAKFNEEQSDIFRKAIPYWAKFVTIVDNEFSGGKSITKSLEGIKAIFDSMLERKEFPDAITLDFYQFVSGSKVNPMLSPRQVLEALSELLNTYKDILPCPIIVMSQIWPDSDDNGGELENKIKGSKSILVPSTVAIELITDTENFRTEWKIHKNRFNGATVGKIIKTGFDRGRFVRYDNEFKEKVERIKQRALDKQIGLGDVFDKEDKDGNKN